MQVKIFPFGQIAEVVEQEIISVPDGSELQNLKKLLEEKFPKLSSKAFLFAVNQEIVHGNPLLKEGDEVALLPPYAGG
jgi:molybdopterin converting factor small subunit